MGANLSQETETAPVQDVERNHTLTVDFHYNSHCYLVIFDRSSLSYEHVKSRVEQQLKLSNPFQILYRDSATDITYILGPENNTNVVQEAVTGGYKLKVSTRKLCLILSHFQQIEVFEFQGSSTLSSDSGAVSLSSDSRGNTDSETGDSLVENSLIASSTLLYCFVILY